MEKTEKSEGGGKQGSNDNDCQVVVIQWSNSCQVMVVQLSFDSQAVAGQVLSFFLFFVRRLR